MRKFATSFLALLLAATAALADFVTTSGPVHPSGVRALIDLPAEQHMQNVGGSDGYGLCVGTSCEVTGRWQTIPELDGFQKWLRKRPGGSYPEQLARDIKLFTAAKGVVTPVHIQHTGGDVEFFRIVMKTRRAADITYAGHDKFYGNETIAHMVTAAHLDGKLGAIIDNNEPTRWRWMDDVQLINRWLGRHDDGSSMRDRRGRSVGGGWLVVWLKSPPPPIDTTAPDYLPERATVVEAGIDGSVTPVDPDSEFPTIFDPVADGGNPLLDGGVNSDMLKPKLRYWINGEECDRCKAIEALRGADGGFSDDSGLPFVSVISDDPAVAKLVHETLKEYAGKLHVGVFKSDSWIAQQRLKARVTAQRPAADGGRLVFRSDEPVTADMLRKAAKQALGIQEPPPPMPDPVTPAQPDPVQPAPDATPPAAPRIHWLWIVIGGVVITILIFRRS